MPKSDIERVDLNALRDKVSAKWEPENFPSVDKWERGLDPWHADAFKGTPAEGMFVSPEPRKTGWYALDWCGNVIGFVADGTPFNLNPFKAGP